MFSLRRVPGGLTPLDLAVEHVALGAGELLQGAYVLPVVVRDVAVERTTLLEELREELFGEIVLAVFGVGDLVHHRGFQEVDAGVHGVGEDLSPGRLLEEARDPAVLLGYDDAEVQRVLDALEDHGGLGALLLVELDEAAEVGVGQGVAAYDEQPLAFEAQLLLGHLHGARRPGGRVLDRVAHVDAPVRAVAEVVPDLIGQELQRDGDVRKAMALQELRRCAPCTAGSLWGSWVWAGRW